jgi:hypothetical protein
VGLNEQPETETDELLNQFETQLEQVKSDVRRLIVYSYKLVSLVREMKQLRKIGGFRRWNLLLKI